jgi:hypothetical protein
VYILIHELRKAVWKSHDPSFQWSLNVLHFHRNMFVAFMCAVMIKYLNWLRVVFYTFVSNILFPTISGSLCF